jgi:hypothetical protein
LCLDRGHARALRGGGLRLAGSGGAALRAGGGRQPPAEGGGAQQSETKFRRAPQGGDFPPPYSPLLPRSLFPIPLALSGACFQGCGTHSPPPASGTEPRPACSPGRGSRYPRPASRTKTRPAGSPLPSPSAIHHPLSIFHFPPVIFLPRGADNGKEGWEGAGEKAGQRRFLLLTNGPAALLCGICPGKGRRRDEMEKFSGMKKGSPGGRRFMGGGQLSPFSVFWRWGSPNAGHLQ